MAGAPLFYACVYSQPYDNALEFLNSYAIKLYNKGDMPSARHEFQKVLLVDPQNQLARYYLSIIIQKYAPKPAPAKPAVKPAVKVKKVDLGAIDLKLAESRQRIARLEQGLLKSAMENALLKARLNAAQQHREDTEASYMNKLVDNLRRQIGEAGSRIRKLKDKLAQKQIEGGQYAGLEKRAAEIEALLEARQRELEGTRKELREGRMSAAFDASRIASLEEGLSRKDEIIGKLEKDRTALREEIISIRQENLKLLEGLRSNNEDTLKHLEEFESMIALKEGEMAALRDDLQKRLAEKESRIRELAEAAGAADSDMEAFKEELRSRESRIDALTRELDEKDGLISDLEDGLKARQDEIAAIKKELRERLLQKERDVEGLEKALEEGRLRTDRFKEETEGQKQRISALLEEIGRKDNLLDSAEEASRSRQEEISDMRAELEAALAGQDIQSQELRGGYEEQISRLLGALELKDSEIEDRDSLIEGLRADINAKEEEASVLREELAQASYAKDKDIESVIKDYEGRIEMLLRNIDGKAEEIGGLKKLNEDLSSRLNRQPGEDLVSLTEALRSEVSEKEGIIAALSDDLEEQSRKVSSLEKEKIELLGNLNRNNEEALKRVEAFEGAVDNRQKELLSSIEEKDSQIAALKEEMDLKETQIKSIQDSNAKLVEEFNRESDGYREQIEGLQDALAAARKGRLSGGEYKERVSDSLRLENDVLKGKLDQGKLELLKRDRALLEKDDGLFKLKQRYESLAAQKQEQEDIARAKEEEKKRLQEQLEDLRDKVSFYKGKEVEGIEVYLRDNQLIVYLQEVLLFEPGEAEIKEGGSSALGRIAMVLNEDFPEARIIIMGHTDDQPINVSGWQSNWELSSARAVSVLHYFSANFGVDERRLSAAGFGEFNPVASNDTPEGRQRNRRVEIAIAPQK